MNKKYPFLKIYHSCLHLKTLLLLLIVSSLQAQNNEPSILREKSGKIVRTKDSKGNVIPDFSYAGYQSGASAIPNGAIKAFVPHIFSDATATIQTAINYVSNLKPDSDGLRGVVLLDKGIFTVSGTLNIKESGVILRGSGKDDNGTIIIGTGTNREAIINVSGKSDRKLKQEFEVSDAFIPLGSKVISLKNATAIKKGDQVLINTPISKNWIDILQMNEFGGETGWIGWKKDDFVIRADREVTDVLNNQITIDVPLTNALDENLSSTTVVVYSWPGRINNVGVENLTLMSDFDTTNPKDEQHRWYGISINNVQDAWLRQINFEQFAGGAVSILKTAKRITVEDCISRNPVSEIAAFRRNSFYTEGQQTLFQRCYSEYGYNDFAVGGNATAGPNVFLQCESFLPFSFSGSVGSWATGMLFDVVKIDGNVLSFSNKEQDGRGLGWNAANSVIWETSASKIENHSPPTANNWAFGVWAQWAGNGHWNDVNSHINPRSLYYALLEQRLGKLPMQPQIMDLGSEPSSSPTIEQAAKLTAESYKKQTTLLEWIEEASTRNPIAINPFKAKVFSEVKPSKTEVSSQVNKIEIKNGLLIGDKGLLTGEIVDVPWWRGSLRDSEISKARPHVTRFAPGHYGLGYTDNLMETVQFLADNNKASLDHNYGLWYEQRMADHERIRRLDADVWAPFYEQPFDRTGQGIAWDHLSKYDLTRYNTWYWKRLKTFAELAVEKSKILMNQQYFQHNILEAGAHWSSSPWRPANNVNSTGLPEPPPYIGDKRIFIAEQFYDVTNENIRKLHQGFIEKNLENFKDNSNVLQLTSAEYTGPLSFMEFWLDVVANYEKTHQNESKITLSATKDVQDSILKNADRAATVDVIDIRYWYYKEDGSLYAPEGGKNLAPRQHARQMKVGKETEEQVFRAVREYREKYSDKAVIYSTPAANRFGWSVLFGGGSLAAIPEIKIEGFYDSLVLVKTVPEENYSSPIWTLQDEGETYLFYLLKAKQLKVDLSKYKGVFEVYWINPGNGNLIAKENIKGKAIHNLTAPGAKETKVIAYIKKK